MPTLSLDDPGDVPAGLAFTPGAGGTATLAGTPTGASGSVPLTVRAKNGNGADATQTLTVTVAAAQAPTIPLPQGSIKSTGGGFVGLPGTAPGGGPPMTNTVTVVVGQESYTISAGKITTVKVTLGKTGKGLLRRFHKLKVKVKVTVTTTSGQKQIATKTVTIKAPKAKKKKG